MPWISDKVWEGTPRAPASESSDDRSYEDDLNGAILAIVRAHRDDEAEECAKIAEEEMRRIVDGRYDEGRADAGEAIRDAIRERIKVRQG